MPHRVLVHAYNKHQNGHVVHVAAHYKKVKSTKKRGRKRR